MVRVAMVPSLCVLLATDNMAAGEHFISNLTLHTAMANRFKVIILEFMMKNTLSLPCIPFSRENKPKQKLYPLKQ